MTREELASIQNEHAAQALHSLFMGCRERFLSAARLLQLRGPVLHRLASLGVTEPVDLRPLYALWRVMCRWYLDRRFSPQLPLFPWRELDPLVQWWNFVYHEVFETLTQDNEAVRCVLRATGALPCEDAPAAAQALLALVKELCLSDYRPSWDRDGVAETAGGLSE